MQLVVRQLNCTILFSSVQLGMLFHLVIILVLLFPTAPRSLLSKLRLYVGVML